MGSLRVTVCTGVLAAAALTPAAHAADSGDARKTGSVSAAPATAAPGADITLRVTDCARRTAVAASPAFVADARLTVTDAARELTGESRVRSTLAPGTYTVRVTCGEAERTGTLTVREDSAGGPAVRPPQSVPGPGGRPLTPGTGGPPPVPGGDGQSYAPAAEPDDDPEHAGEGDAQSSADRRPVAPASPVAPVRAGGGGAAHLIAAEERGAGPGTAQGVTGLVLAGVAALVVALGGVRRSRGTD